jgi:uncharacterized protein
MEQIKSLSSSQKRITVFDALRGFALLGVILIHMLQRFGIRTAASTQINPSFPALDEIIQWIGQNIIMGRFVNIFAFLFGLSFFIQMDSAAKKGIDFRKRFVWRMFLLFLLGAISHSFYSLEIISVYAVFGLLMIPLYRVKNWILLTIACLILLGAPRIIQATVNNKAISLQTENQPSRNIAQSPPPLPAHIANPSFLNSAKYNYEERFTGKLNYQFGMIGRGYLTFSMFLIGLVVGRIRFFEKLSINKTRNLFLFLGTVLATFLASWIINIMPQVETRILFNPGGKYISPLLLTVKTLEDINLVLFSGALAMGFIIIYQTKAGKYLDLLSPYGRMGLTNYIMQGFIGSMLFSLWAFGSVFSAWGPTELFALGLVIYVSQIVFSKCWLKYFLYGPLEWLWRSATYMKLQPFRKTYPL